MNLKDRLVISKRNSISTQIPDNQYTVNFSEVFANSSVIGSIIRTLIDNNKNIIFTASREFEKTLFVQYFKNLLSNYAINIEDNFNEYNLSINNKINIYRNTEIPELVKIFEAIITGYKTFAICLNINSAENILEKIKAVIAINYPNMTEKMINTLISESNAVFVNISEIRGELVVSSIDELVKADSLSLKEIYSYIIIENNNLNEEKEEIQNIKPTNLKNILEDEELLNYEPSIQLSETKEENTSEEKIDLKEEQPNTIEEAQNIVEIDEKSTESTNEHNEELIENQESEKEISIEEPKEKINKYKLLREKVKSKKAN